MIYFGAMLLKTISKTLNSILNSTSKQSKENKPGVNSRALFFVRVNSLAVAFYILIEDEIIVPVKYLYKHNYSNRCVMSQRHE